MAAMDWKLAITNWRKLPPERQKALRLSTAPGRVARSMAFEGEPVDQARLEAALKSRTMPPATSTPRSGG